MFPACCRESPAVEQRRGIAAVVYLRPSPALSLSIPRGIASSVGRDTLGVAAQPGHPLYEGGTRMDKMRYGEIKFPDQRPPLPAVTPCAFGLLYSSWRAERERRSGP